MSDRRAKANAIFDELINSQESDFWMYPSPKGLALMKECAKRLSELGSGVFSGHPERNWTFTTIAEKVDSLNRRITRWESDLISKQDNGIKFEVDSTLIKGKLPTLKESEQEIELDSSNDGLFSVRLFLKSLPLKGKSYIGLYGEAIELNLDGSLASKKTEMLGRHKPNKQGEETILYSIEPYTVSALHHLITC